MAAAISTTKLSDHLCQWCHKRKAVGYIEIKVTEPMKATRCVPVCGVCRAKSEKGRDDPKL
jgi:hypothetical protein